MLADLQSTSKYPRLWTVMVWWRNFSRQWRHCYLLLIAMFWFVWRVSLAALPDLDNTRIMGGLHPVNVFILMDLLKLMGLLPLAVAALYALSFAIRPLNTAEAIAGSALCSCAFLALVLVAALFGIIL